MNAVLIVLVAKYLIVIPVVLALYLAYRLPSDSRSRFLLLSIISLPLIYVIAKAAGHFYFDARPFVVDHVAPLMPHVADNGFPSDHALLAAALASVMYVFDKRLALVSWVCALLIGVARVLAHVHHTTDIVGSFLIAAVVVLIVNAILERMRLARAPAEAGNPVE